MTTTDLFEAALALPIKHRSELARRLLASLDGPADRDSEEAWAREITRRAEEVRRGEADLVDGDEVYRKARERLLAHRR